MYCNKCRSSIPDGSRYCNFCGADQKAQKSSSKSWLVNLVILIVVVFVFRWVGLTLGKAIAGWTAGGENQTSAWTQPKNHETQPQQEGYLQYVQLTLAEEPRRLGDGGSCGVLETLSPVKNCTRVNFTLDAEGNYGASTKGNWEVHFRIGGKWKKVQTIYYSGAGEESFTIYFDPAASFDAVCAFPTQRGNYSYHSSMSLSDAYCS